MKSELKQFKKVLADTWYRGFYYDTRDGKRVGVVWRHQFNIQGKLINEEEVSVTEAPLKIYAHE